MRLRLVLLAALVWTGGVGAAELPSRGARAKPAEPARSCEIAGERGVALPGGGCVRIGGYVSVGVTGGSRRP